MQKYQDVVLNQNGNPVSGVQVTVTDLAGSPVSVYSANAIGLNVNPLTSDNNGRFSFYAPDGRYNLSFSFGGNVVASITDILLEDPMDGSDAVFNDVTILGELSDASKVTSAPVGGLTATNVQAALAELDSEKIDASSLAASGGSALVGYDDGTAQDVLDEAKPMANYTALRNYTGRATGVRITQSGVSGFFQRDDADTSSADNGGTLIVDASGRRWKRLFVGRVHAVWFGAKADWNGTTGTDNTGPIRAAIHYAATLGLVGPSVELPPGKLRITAKITTAGAGNVGQVGLVGAGKTATTLCPDGDFTAVNLVTSLIESGDFSVEWPVTAAASIPATRIGVELASGSYQFSNAVLKNVEVRYGYRGVIQNDWTGQPLGTAWLFTLYKVTAFRCADWGFWLNSKPGSTTLRMVQCYVRGDSSAGGQYGKGVFANNFNDIQTDQLAIDQCVDQWILFQNYNLAVLNGTALEANRMSSPSARAIHFNGAQVVMNGVKDISCTYDTGGIAQVIYCGANCTLALTGYNEQYSTVAAGTTKYRIAFNSANSQIAINDRTVIPSQVLDNGWFANVVYEGRRLSRVGQAPNYGSWLRGDNVLNGAPSVGQPKGWVCTVAGSPGTWVSEGNL